MAVMRVRIHQALALPQIEARGMGALRIEPPRDTCRFGVVFFEDSLSADELTV